MITKALEIEGWMSNRELEFLADIARDAELILEAGCYLGRSTRALTDNCKGTVYSVDPYSGPYYQDNNKFLKHIGDEHYEKFKRNLADHLISGKLKHTRTEFVNFQHNDKYHHEYNFDFIFLDGDHRYDAVKSDVLHAITLASKNGIIAGHDYTHSDWPGVKKAVDEIFRNIKLVDSIWYTQL